MHLELKALKEHEELQKAPGETGTRSKTTGTRGERKGDSRLARRGGPQGQNC